MADVRSRGSCPGMPSVAFVINRTWVRDLDRLHHVLRRRSRWLEADVRETAVDSPLYGVIRAAADVSEVAQILARNKRERHDGLRGSPNLRTRLSHSDALASSTPCRARRPTPSWSRSMAGQASNGATGCYVPCSPSSSPRMPHAAAPKLQARHRTGRPPAPPAREPLGSGRSNHHTGPRRSLKTRVIRVAPGCSRTELGGC
jgi:hypothetical protein